MSGKTDRKIRKAVNKRFAEVIHDRNAIADNLVLELMNSPFKYRLRFALTLVFPRRKKNG